MGVAYNIPRATQSPWILVKATGSPAVLWTVTDCDPVATVCTCTTPIRVTTPSCVGQPYFSHPVRTTTEKYMAGPEDYMYKRWSPPYAFSHGLDHRQKVKGQELLETRVNGSRGIFQLGHQGVKQ